MSSSHHRSEIEATREHPTARLVEQLLLAAIDAGASDLHVDPTPAGGEVRMRVDGFFEPLRGLDRETTPRVVARLKALAGISSFRNDLPQDGRLEVALDGRQAELRLSTIPVVDGERAVVRCFDLAKAPRRLEELDFSATVREATRGLLELPPGLILVVGPCSSGKTTTLYALARDLRRRHGACLQMASAEDPVEQRVEGMAQSEIAPLRGLDFARLLRSILRQDPDVLFVTETRDAESAEILVEAAFTGHRVFTSMHAADADEIVHRLAALGVALGLAGEALRGAVCQRLVRRLCAVCHGSGCERCRGRGFVGRLAIGEVVRFDRGRRVSLTPPIRDDAAARVGANDTTAEEIERVLGGGRP